MTEKIELPSKYYHSHFKELCAVLLNQYSVFFEEKHHDFLTTFHALSEDAQCLYLRMMNRKGRIFFREKLIYPEIISFDEALSELYTNRFVEKLHPFHWDEFLGFLPKKELCSLLLIKDAVFKKSWPREALENELRGLGYFENDLMNTYIVQSRTEEISYLLFLYFGRIQENLSLYTLRDLGIRQVSREKKNFKTRFHSREEALSHYFYSKLAEDHSHFPQIDLWPVALNHESQLLRESVILAIGDDLKNNGSISEALSAYQFSESHPGREKYVRLLYQEGAVDACRIKLSEILENPFSDEEYLFAEDFEARKFGGRKRSILTETLRNARKIGIDESYFRHPEEGVLAYFQERGIQGYHTENYLWNCLFGLIFWEELYESEHSSLFNEFERLPRDLLEKTFLTVHRDTIAKKLDALKDKKSALDILLQKAESKKDIQNGIFGWHESIPSMLTLLLNHADDDSLVKMLLHMAGDFHHRSSGFPDIFTVEEGKVKFYEVKAPGDSLKQRQLLQMLALQKAEFLVEVLQVEYIFNPYQMYVVVDIETTGSFGAYHRITELGAVKMQNGEVQARFQTLVNPERHISREIETLTGISNEMVQNAPKFHEVADAFDEFTKGCIFVAHNVSFDYGFIQQEFGKLERRFVRPYICTKTGIKKHFPGLESYGLKNLCAHFGISLVNHHRALADAEAAAELLILITQKRSMGVKNLDTP